MPRRKLYNTKEQRREANRRKNKLFYDKNRSAILESKKEKRVQERQAQEKRDIQQRKKHREQRKRAGKVDERIDQEQSAFIVPNRVEVAKELEARLERLQQQYQKEIQHNHRTFLDQLSVQALQWKLSTQGSLMTRNLAPSPALLAKKSIDSMLDEYNTIESEYFYCIRDRWGWRWEEKRQEFKLFKEVSEGLIEVLGNIHESLVMDGYNPDADELRELYQYKYT
ncbi:hypothetical protein PM082_014233 [Marasmius tenuissimus]|nr:hypothetical protein PM082_014233 [Marasmius tenuissimus]